MSETQLDEVEEKNIPVEVLEKMDERYRVGKTVMAVMVVGLIASQFIHELGHAIALNLLGISITFLFEIRAVGPVLITHGLTWPTAVPELVFVIAAGGGFAAIVFALLGRFWRIECYIVATSQVFYAIFEIVSWMVGLQAGEELTVLFYLFGIIVVPTVLVGNHIANLIVRAKYFS